MKPCFMTTIFHYRGIRYAKTALFLYQQKISFSPPSAFCSLLLYFLQDADIPLKHQKV